MTKFGRNVHKAACLLIIVSLFAVSSCSSEPVIIGDTMAYQYTRTTFASLELNYIDMIDSAVTIQMKFQNRLPGIFGDHDAIMTKSDFGELIVLIPQGKYSDMLKNLSKGDDVVVNGTVTSVTPPGRSKSFLAIKAV